MRTAPPLTISLIILVVLGWSATTSFAEAQYTLKNTVYVKATFTQTVINRGPGALSALDVYVLPPINTSRQKVLNFLNQQPPVSVEEDEWGQRIFKHSFHDVQPGQTVNVSWVALVELSEINYDVSPSDVGNFSDVPAGILELYTRDDTMYDIYNSIVQNAANEAVGSETNPYYMVQRIHDYVITHLTYEMDTRWDPAPIILSRGKGSCSEYTCVFIAMCRAKGIPARFAGGSAVSNPGQYKVETAGHRWQEVYLPNHGWLPIDVTWDDSVRPERTHLYFLRMLNTHLTMATAGGGSKYMAWSYNAKVDFHQASSTNAKAAFSCIWEPATPNTPVPEYVHPAPVLVVCIAVGFLLIRSRRRPRFARSLHTHAEPCEQRDCSSKILFASAT